MKEEQFLASFKFGENINSIREIREFCIKVKGRGETQSKLPFKQQRNIYLPAVTQVKGVNVRP